MLESKYLFLCKLTWAYSGRLGALRPILLVFSTNRIQKLKQSDLEQELIRRIDFGQNFENGKHHLDYLFRIFYQLWNF